MQHTILITGAGKGIGKAIALGFAKAAQDDPGFTPQLLLVSRSADDLAAVAQKCQQLGTPAETAVCDISSVTETRHLAARAIERHGTISCLVNNAGIGRFGELAELTEKDFDDTIGTNLKGTFFLTQALFPAMEHQRSGHIFFITSVAAEKAFRHSAIYCMSKFGQQGLVETMRLYARPCNVRITEVLAGAVLTPMWGMVDETTRQMMMQPEDIATAVVQAYLQPGRTTVEQIVLRPTGGDLQDSE